MNVCIKGAVSQLTVTCSRSAIEKLEKGEKYVQSFSVFGVFIVNFKHISHLFLGVFIVVFELVNVIWLTSPLSLMSTFFVLSNEVKQIADELTTTFTFIILLIRKQCFNLITAIIDSEVQHVCKKQFL